jgi:hypothetical protein
LTELIANEQERITQDPELRKKYADLKKQLEANAFLRDFQTYLDSHEDILPFLANIKDFQEQVWKSYIKAKSDLYFKLLSEYQSAAKRKGEIKQEAEGQRTQWEEAIDIFNDRFHVPFTLIAENRIPVMLGQEPMLKLGYEFHDGADAVSVKRGDLMQALSQGEKKALYVLNIIFEVEVRRKANQDTFFVVDDIADSFDYKNKYAIIQYLKDIEDVGHFNQIILTHNFDFLRTVQSRFAQYDRCLMAIKSSVGIELRKAEGIKNIFVNGWKSHFYTDAKKRIACIAFMRNLIEYQKGLNDPVYIQLTSLLHWKNDSPTITEADLDQVFDNFFSSPGSWPNSNEIVIDNIANEAQSCLSAPDGVNFEHKIVMSIAIRIAAEKYMVNKIADPVFVSAISGVQTPILLDKFESIFGRNDVLRKVVLMTPANIHLNSFMYEPILDMSDGHLRQLLGDVNALV